MNKLTEQFFDAPAGVFTQAQITAMVEGTDFSRHGLVKRAIAQGDILNIKRGLYCLAPRWQRKSINSLSIAQHIYGPSYVSLETALNYHGWIPEAVHTCTSVCLNNAKDFHTPLGLFTYQRVPQVIFFQGVDRCCHPNGGCFFMATGPKALADYVYIHHLDWTSLDEAVSSLRIDEEILNSVEGELLVDLASNYTNGRVKRFLAAWQEEVSR